MKYRAIYDNISQIIKVTKGPNIPDSFHDLRKRILYGKINLEKNYSNLISDCFWFDEIRDVRIAIEHHAAESNVDFNSDEIMFKVSSLGFGLDGLPDKNIIKSPLTINSTDSHEFTKFSLFAGVYVGYLISNLEDLSNIISQELQNLEFDSTGKDSHPGYGLIRTWIESVLKFN